MTRADGYFTAYVNHHAARPGAGEKALMRTIREATDAVVPNSQLRWAGSQRKRTALAGSDLDMCLESRSPVTVAQRKTLRGAIAGLVTADVVIQSHVIRIRATGSTPRVDIAFANAAFGSRKLPDVEAFHGRPARQGAVRGLKLWTQQPGLPHVPGWAAEALVLEMDRGPHAGTALSLFVRTLDWLVDRASPQALEGVLRAATHPAWQPSWSKRLPGRLQALQDHGRRLRASRMGPETWKAAGDVGAWFAQ